jgi:hypothetical protein
MEAKKFWKESTTQTKVTNESEDHCCYDLKIDVYENLPSFHEEFFDCFEEEEFQNNEQHPSRDLLVLNLDSAHSARIVIDCTNEIIGTASMHECTTSFKQNISDTLLAQEHSMAKIFLIMNQI